MIAVESRDPESNVGTDYIRSRLQQLQTLIDMLEDDGWGMKEVGQKRGLAALVYFNNPDDLIPDHIPGLGSLDDAIMLELLCRELKPEIEAYSDFATFRSAAANRQGIDPAELNRAGFIKNCEDAMLSRMWRRRGRRSGGGGGRSPFSLF